jgi:predicted nucleic acid-binding protein
MLRYMLDTNICIYVIKSRPAGLRERFNSLADQHDMMIGGHARSEGLTLVSNNLREFQRMEGLRLENWV